MLNYKKIALHSKNAIKWWLPYSDLNEARKKYNDMHAKSNTGVKQISTQNLSKVYDNGIKAIDDLSLRINSGEFIVLLGPSGCGKTTLLRMIAGLESVSDGYIKFDNITMNSVPSKDREIAMVFQNYALYPFMNVFKNISFGLKNKTRKNKVYSSLKNELKEVKNPLFDEIKAIKVEFSNNLFFGNQRKDELLRVKRTCKVMKKAKKSNHDINKTKKDLDSLRSEYWKFIFSWKRYKKLHSIFWKMQGIKFRNVKLKFKDRKNINAKELIILQKMFDAAKLWKNNIPNVVEDISKMLNINMYTNRKPSELSGGQRQRVALARAISKETSLYLYDEPLSNLDAKLRAGMRREIRKIHERMKATSVYVTHDQIEAMSMADRIVVMNKGYILQIGTPEELLTSPANLFVAKFIGNTEVNVFKVKHLQKNTFKVGTSSFDIVNSRKNINFSNHKDIVLGIRPEHIITDMQIINNMKQNKYTGKITDVEILGNDVLVSVNHKDFKNINMLVPLVRKPKRGDSIDFILDPNKAFIYDYDSGDNLLINFDEENEHARSVWVKGEEERKKNLFIMHKEKNKAPLTLKFWQWVFYPFSKTARDKIENRKSKVKYDNQRSAR